MRFDLLASGSKGNCCLVRSKNHAFLIDCGISRRYLNDKLKELEFDKEEVEFVLVTHSHSDHTKGLWQFAHKPIYSYCHLTIKDSQKTPLNFEHYQLIPQQSLVFEEFVITPFALSHDSGPTVGFLIEESESSESLVYLTDTGYFRTEYYDLLSNATYYIMESNHDPQMLLNTRRPMIVKQRILSDTGHLSNFDSARHLSNLIGPETRQIVLAHLSQEANLPELALETLKKTLDESEVEYSGIQIDAAAQFEIISSISKEKITQKDLKEGQAEPENHIRKETAQN